MKAANLSPRFWVSAGLLGLILVLAIFGPFIVRTSPDAVIGGLYDPPSFGSLPMWLGTDNEGQSVLSNLLFGTRTSLIVGLMAGSIATAVGLVLGLIAGFQGGVVDDIIVGVTNALLSIPGIVIVILLGVALGSRSPVALAFVIGITGWPWLTRAVRAQTSSIRVREHIEVARLSGARWISILGWDVLPYLLSYVVMSFVLMCSGAILAEATLSMLGLGPSGSVSLGTMFYWAIVWGSVRVGALWAFIPPTVMLTAISFSLLMLNTAGDEIFNPRLRRGRKAKKTRRPMAPATVAASTVTGQPAATGTLVTTPRTSAPASSGDAKGALS